MSKRRWTNRPGKGRYVAKGENRGCGKGTIFNTKDGTDLQKILNREGQTPSRARPGRCEEGWKKEHRKGRTTETFTWI